MSRKKVIPKRPALRKASAARRPSPRFLSGNDTLLMILEAAEMTCWVWDLPEDQIYYSANITSLARGENLDRYLSSAQLIECVHPEDRPVLQAGIDKTKSLGEPFCCEYRVRVLDGTYRWIFGRGKRVIRKRGGWRVIGVSQDITARKEAELELARRAGQLVELSSQLVISEQRERRRLAEILHGQLQQILVGARVRLDLLETELQPDFNHRVSKVRDALLEALELSRGLTRDLAPPTLPRGDFFSNFIWLAEDMKERYGLKVEVRVGASPAEMHEATGVLLYTTARELLLNVVKHAGTQRAWMTIKHERGGYWLEVRDKGVGALARQQRVGHHSGYGLFGIRERAEWLGGAFTWKSRRGRGVSARLFLPEQAAPRV
ncbi:MAG TPA: PAS domain-containing protein [Kiritimatiellia bacterium]|nr:PAS domain-containing protein [Kiritimatiellia bacterium]